MYSNPGSQVGTQSKNFSTVSHMDFTRSLVPSVVQAILIMIRLYVSSLVIPLKRDSQECQTHKTMNTGNIFHVWMLDDTLGLMFDG